MPRLCFKYYDVIYKQLVLLLLFFFEQGNVPLPIMELWTFQNTSCCHEGLPIETRIALLSEYCPSLHKWKLAHWHRKKSGCFPKQCSADIPHCPYMVSFLFSYLKSQCFKFVFNHTQTKLNVHLLKHAFAVI